jgi:hypothetical protein
MQRLPLAMILLAVFLCVPGVAGAAVEDATSEVPFSIEKGHVIVQAKIKNETPVEVILSTGAEHSTVDTGLIDKYKLQSGYAGEPPVTGKNDRVYFFSIVPDVHIGGAKAASLTMRLVSLSDVSKAVGREIFGVLGADFFKGRVVLFDFKNKVVRFLNQSSADALKDKKVGANSNEPAVLRMIENDDPYKNVTVPVVEGFTFDGKQVRVLLDTGALMVIGLSSSAAKKLGFTVPAEKGAARADKVGSLRVAAYEFADVPILISAKGTELERELSEHGVVVGIAVLKNFVITFDFRSKVVILERI